MFSAAAEGERCKRRMQAGDASRSCGSCRTRVYRCAAAVIVQSLNNARTMSASVNFAHAAKRFGRVMGRRHACVRALVMAGDRARAPAPAVAHKLMADVREAVASRRYDIVVYADHLLQALPDECRQQADPQAVDAVLLRCSEALREAQVEYALCGAYLRWHGGARSKVPAATTCQQCKVHELRPCWRPQSKTESKTESEPRSEPESGSKSETQSELKSEPQSELKSEPRRSRHVILMCNTSQQIAEACLRSGVDAAARRALAVSGCDRQQSAVVADDDAAKELCSAGAVDERVWGMWDVYARTASTCDAFDCAEVSALTGVVLCVTRRDCMLQQHTALRRVRQALALLASR